MRLFFALIAFFIPNILHADSPIYVECDGAACRCQLSDVNYDEAVAMMGEIPAGFTDAIVLNTANGIVWSDLSPQEAANAAGSTTECAIELFPPLVPLDGTWTGSVTDRTLEACPDALAAGLDPFLAGMVTTRQITWGGVFDPDKFRGGTGEKAINWTKITADHYSGYIPTGAEGSPLDVGVVWDSQLKSEDFARSVVRIRISFRADDPTAAGIFAAAGLANCKVRATVDFARTGS